jgi:hypothetical protein
MQFSVNHGSIITRYEEAITNLKQNEKYRGPFG